MFELRVFPSNTVMLIFSQSLARLYVEAIKSVGEGRTVPSKLRSAFSAERQREEREAWRKEEEVGICTVVMYSD